MDFRYKAKVDNKWLKGRSLTDKKEDATEFESESEPTQIINQLKRDGKIAQKAAIKIVKKRESIEVNNKNKIFENLLQEKVGKTIKTPYGKMQVVDEFVIEDDDKLAFVEKAEAKYKELDKDGWLSLENTEPYWYAFPYNRAKFTLCANKNNKVCFIDWRKADYDFLFENLGINIDYNKIYREGKIKEFGPTYYYNLMAKYSEKLCNAKNDLEEAFFEYIHDAFWYASESIKSAQYRFYLRQLIAEPSSIDYYHGEDFEEDYAYDFKQFIKDPIKNESILKKYLNKEDIPAWENLKNLFSDDKSYERFNKKYKKEREDSEAKRAESEANFKQETKPLDDAIKSAGLEIFYFEYFENINEFAFVINTEDEYDAENARDEVAKVLNGAADNAYGASYDDIEGMGDVHLGCMQFYEFSEMNGGDKYEDLDEDYRDKYVIFACPKQKWINYRRNTDW